MRQTEFIEVKRTFTEEEMAQKAHELGAVLNERAEIDAERKRINDEYKKRLAGVDAVIGDLAENCRNGFDMVEREVYLVKDFQNNKVYYHDNETDEPLDERPMRPEDRQLWIENEEL